MTKSFLSLLTFALLVVACSTGKTSRKKVTLVPLHGGILLPGKAFHVEIVPKKESLAIYTLKSGASGTIRTIPAGRSEVYARYSLGESPASWGLPLKQEKDHYVGSLDTHDEDSYEVYLDLKVDGKKEKFTHVVVAGDGQENF